MTKKIKENIEAPINIFEEFEKSIFDYCKTFLDAREVMESEKIQN